MGVYSNTQIRDALKKGHVVIHPFIEKHLAGSSVDVTLGHYYYRTERTGDFMRVASLPAGVVVPQWD